LYFSHHESHAAAGYYTAPFDDCNILVIDAVGEWNTISIWDNMKKIKTWNYPYSLGLLYSAITKRIGLYPDRDEYITMGMAAYGEPIYDLEPLLLQNNHKGVS
jgi:carbamoyltransferase